MELTRISTAKAAQPGGWYSQAFRVFMYYMNVLRDIEYRLNASSL